MTTSTLYPAPSGVTYILPTSLVDYFEHCVGGEPELSLIQWTAQFLHGDYAFVDAGAHVGTYTLHFAPKCREVFAFEPQRATYYRLCGGIALSGSHNVHAVNVALGESERAEQLLAIPSPDGGLSTIADGIPHAAGAPTEVVAVHALDRYSLDRVGLIKIDVEGSELAVLRGAKNTLKRSGWPRLLIEVWTDPWFSEQRKALLAELDSLGYTTTPIRGYSYMLLAEHPDRKILP